MNDHEPVAIFWDYENCTPPSTISGYDIVGNIRQIAHTYGSVKLFKAYLELSEQPKPINLRSELQSCGVSLTDCPHNGRKDVADKMMIVDMLTYAIDTPAPATIVVISGDRDFVYAVSVLRLRRYRVVLVIPTSAHASLRSQASNILDWERDILGRTAREGSRPLSCESGGGGSNASYASHRRSQSSVATLVTSPMRPSTRLPLKGEAPNGYSANKLQPAANIVTPQFRTTATQTSTPTSASVPHSALLTPLATPGELRPPPRPFAPVHDGMYSHPKNNEPIADLNMHLKSFEEQLKSFEECLNSETSSTYQTAPSVMSEPSPTYVVINESTPEALTGSSFIDNTLSAANPDAATAPRLARVGRIYDNLVTQERLVANPTTSPRSLLSFQKHDDDYDSDDSGGPPTASPPPVEYKFGSMTVWSNSTSEVSTLGATPSTPNSNPATTSSAKSMPTNVTSGRSLPGTQLAQSPPAALTQPVQTTRPAVTPMQPTAAPSPVKSANSAPVMTASTQSAPAPASAPPPAPTQSAPALTKSTPTPAKPVPAPAKSVPAPVKPVPAPAKSVLAPTKPAPAPAKPASSPAQPAPASTKSASASAQPATAAASATVQPSSAQATASSSSSSSAPLPPPPAHFIDLLIFLERCRKVGVPRPLRSNVALTLTQQNKDIYKLAGVKNWTQYAAAAENLGMVTLGGKSGDAWISLQPSWYGRVPLDP
ncbi:DUF537-domain-containing protein [Wolfiporia cocos MD-104 SS10]|uniref:DUF537-domain-containing protein n=1 Tax=Wolfiporia cocos (strain MD-104) TaxID=742152 RepID=A0A2H3J816_WOLCO|nr:DUF537-domain-containing protein [Wolfiporia cocos MD-104 SS10]